MPRRLHIPRGYARTRTRTQADRPGFRDLAAELLADPEGLDRLPDDIPPEERTEPPG